ncbi:unnamed protein product [Darwinula stevensoni]|uniref:Uncharacterized protein n=1 Tax=Darwinula stevensoni TaxID=69355 RepID=A0A7R9AJZ8_9CRUS|nr:unnamed protein product [Darwinula stevensoni]CAG0908165.1 unnamed protein product [Darwinula stevensoni]
MKFVWPPIAKALDERALKIKHGLEAADKAKRDAATTEAALKAEMQEVNAQSAQRLADAERRAQQIIEEAKIKATEEGNRIIAASRAEAENQAVQVREALREEVAVLAVRGAERILQKEVNAGVHADLLSRLKTEL